MDTMTAEHNGLVKRPGIRCHRESVMSKFALAVAALIVAACGQPGPTVVPSPTPQVGPSATPSSTVDATRSPSPAGTPGFPFSVSCGPVDPAGCEQLAVRLAELAAGHYPGKTISGITIETDGSYTMTFTDGTAVGATVD